MLLEAQDPLQHPAGNSLETLRVAAGLAQLSDLSVHLVLSVPDWEPQSSLRSSSELQQQAQHFLQLLEDAGGSWGTRPGAKTDAARITVG
ncbi:MAG: hypothetical protein HC904_01775 [Blastochloris sp.]|nr:hypothetical protein [Blastochloris sp.]